MLTGLDALGSQTDRPQTEHSRQHNQKSDTRPFAANLEKSPSVEQPSLEGRRGKTVFRLRLQSHVANPARTFDFNQTEQKWLCQEKGAKQVRATRTAPPLCASSASDSQVRGEARQVAARPAGASGAQTCRPGTAPIDRTVGGVAAEKASASGGSLMEWMRQQEQEVSVAHLPLPAEVPCPSAPCCAMLCCSLLARNARSLTRAGHRERETRGRETREAESMHMRMHMRSTH